MINENFVFLGALLNLIGSGSYVYDTLRGKTQPNRVTWFLWALAPLIAFSAMIGQGVSFHASLLTFMVGFGPLMIFIASFVNKKSVWKISRFDMICGALSIAGLIGWLLTRTGDVAILFSIIADTLALLPTLKKAWQDPESESSLVFFNGALSALITLFTLQSFGFTNSGFTIYIFFACVVMFVVIKFKLGVRYRKVLKDLARK